jgi:hypothetical protein
VLALVAVLAVGRPPAPPTGGSSTQSALSDVATPSSDVSGLDSTQPSDPAGPPATGLPAASPTTAPTSASTSTPRSTPKPATCRPTDQDKYVYNPARLAVKAACIHVTGVIEAVRKEADGDLHLLLALDPAYTHLLTPANQGVELGDLVIEPVCVRSVTQADAIDICAADPDPLSPPFPVVGERVWMEGRYVFDLQHGGWAELHPLYRWGDK